MSLTLVGVLLLSAAIALLRVYSPERAAAFAIGSALVAWASTAAAVARAIHRLSGGVLAQCGAGRARNDLDA